MLERPPGGTTIRRPAGLMGTSSGVGGPMDETREKLGKGIGTQKINILGKK